MAAKRILHIVSSLGTGSGVMAVLMNYHRHIDRERLQFDYLSFRNTTDTYEEEIGALGGRVYHISRPSPGREFRGQLKRFFREHQGEYDTIHCHPLYAAVIFAPMAERYGIKRVIQHSHTTKYSDKRLSAMRNRLMLALFGGRITDFAACSEGAKEIFFWKKPDEVFLVPNAIDLQRYAFSATARAELREQHCIPRGATVVGHVGRFAPQKNHHFLLEAFAAYVRRDPAARLLLVGDGELYEKVKREAEARSLGESVIFAGRTGQAERYYSAMDVFALPSVFEGFGLVAAEAQANGLPCVLSDRVPKLADIGGNVQFLPIEKGTEPWLRGLQQAAATGRAKMGVDPAWDIRQAVKRLEGYYLEGCEPPEDIGRVDEEMT